MRMKVGSISFLVIIISVLFVSCNSKKKQLFQSLSPSETSIHFTNKLKKHNLLSILYYLYYYNGGGVATGDVNNDGLIDIYFTANNKSANKLYLNKGNFVFEDITNKAGISGTADWCTGATMTDINADGLLDIYTCAVSGRYDLKGHNELFVNNGNGTFTESAAKYGLDFTGLSTQSAFFDYDRDGDLDCYILNQSHHPHANISDTAKRRTFSPQSGDRLYRNDVTTAGKFTDVSAKAGIFQSDLGYGLGLAVADLNNDGWDDIYVGNDFHENDYYYTNNGNGTFTESGSKHFKHYSRFSMGNDVADYNNDGQLDVVTVDMLPPQEEIVKTYGSDENADIYKVKLDIQGYQKQYSKNCLQRNNGNGTSFSETALQSGVAATDWSWAPLFADFDNDGNKDLFISSGIVKRPVDLDYIKFVSALKMQGMDKTDKYDAEAIEAMPDGASHPFLFKGNGRLQFSDVSKEWGTAHLKGYFTGASYADLNNDGNLDVVINCIESPAVILKNTAPKKNTLQVSLRGDSLNKFAVGAKIWLFANGKMQYQQLMLTRGFQSSCEPRLHFGLDTAIRIDSLLVVWPNQKYQLIKNITPAENIKLNQADAAGLFNYNSFFIAAKQLLELAEKQIDWQHIENDFLDYNLQYLIPHLQSTRGPKIAIADVNNDGLDDFYTCGAKYRPGGLMIQQPDGRFVSTDTALFAINAISEDVAAQFFDANNDGFMDLWVVSGGNEEPANVLSHEDRLYLNDGRGHFSKPQKSIPQQYENKSCIATADVDKDGDMDVFVGNLGNALSYGDIKSSYLFINDGKAGFSLDYKKINLEKPGIVTTATFADINADTWPDLIVTGEWMPIKIFINNKGVFTATDIPQSTGLWQSVYATDINGDGFTDIFAGNWGHNSKLYAGKNGPLKLYIKDFDKNGRIEHVMAYTIDGNEYTFLAKDELERSLPVLKKHYLKYREVAGKTVQYIFYDLFKDYTELKAEELSSCCFLSDGKGNFTKIQLPDELQMAPLFSFAALSFLGSNTFVAGGNFYGTIPYEGRYDAQLPVIFKFNKTTGRFELLSTLSSADGEVRDLKPFSFADKRKGLLIARNNNRPLLFKASK